MFKIEFIPHVKNYKKIGIEDYRGDKIYTVQNCCKCSLKSYPRILAAERSGVTGFYLGI
jgi:hypothetical protein